VSKLVQKFKKPLFLDDIPEKIVKQITFPKYPEITAQKNPYEKRLLGFCRVTVGIQQ
jgi:hypothetical protein